MNKALGLIVVLLIALLPLTAALLTNLPKTITQPDGTTYNCFASGDEYYNWLHDANGYTIIRNNDTGYYTYARNDGNKVVASQYIVGQVNPQSTGLPVGARIDPETYKQIRHRRWAGVSRESRTPTSGIINNLVVFIRFSGEAEFTGSLTTYSSMFNNSAPGTNSMYNYFLEDSYQALTINTSFYPIATNNVIVSFQDIHPRGYYEPYSSSNTLGYSGDNQRETREMVLLQSSINYISAFVPQDMDFDSDNDGQIDNVCFIVKGATGDWADLLWPHMWVMENYTALINGAQVYTFNFQLEDALFDSGVGVLCHEMSHSLGMPDLYHYSYDGFTTVGRWDLMESNRNPPQHHCAYMKSRYTNWLPPMQTLTQSSTYWVNRMLNRERNCFKIASNNPQYYYVVEFRKKQGFFENSLQGSGMLVFRVNTAEDGNGNADGPPDELYLYRPGGTITENGQTNFAHLSQEVNRTAINESSNPTPFLPDGSDGGLNITQIGSSSGDSISFRLELPTPPPTDYDEGFETGDFSAYDWSFETNRNWVVSNTNAYNGTYCAKSGIIANNQVSSMTLFLDVASAGYIGFVKKVSSEVGYDYLKFFIDDVQMGQWSGTSNWSYSQYPITSGAHIFRWSYVKDNGTVSGSDCAWVDNISFRWDAPELFFPPQNLQLSSPADEVAINLSWQLPVVTNSILNGYRIYRDDTQIAELDTTQLHYHDINVIPNRSYAYFIKSVYSNPHGHSISSDTLTISVLGAAIQPQLISAVIVDTNSVHLQWMLPLVDRGIIGFNIYRNGALIQFVDSVTARDWVDADLSIGTYRYQVAARYPAFTTNLSEPLTVVLAYVGNTNQVSVPTAFGIGKCYPNPFKTDTTIQYSIDKDNQSCDISIFNIKGQKISTLRSGVSKAGSFTINWNGKNDKGESVSSGIYYVRLHNLKNVATQRLLLLK